MLSHFCQFMSCNYSPYYVMYTNLVDFVLRSESPNSLEKGALAAVLFGGSPRIKNRQDRGIRTNSACFKRRVYTSYPLNVPKTQSQ